MVWVEVKTCSRSALREVNSHRTRPKTRGCNAGSGAPHVRRIPGELVHAGTVQPSESATTFEGLGLAQSLADHLEGVLVWNQTGCMPWAALRNFTDPSHVLRHSQTACGLSLLGCSNQLQHPNANPAVSHSTLAGAAPSLAQACVQRVWKPAVHHHRLNSSPLQCAVFCC